LEEANRRGIAGTTFFIPIITPRYFRSQQCRGELLRFTTKAEQLELTQLLLPVYHIRVPEFDQEHPEDALMERVKETQWQDWRALALEDLGSSAVRQGVRKMAEKLAEISAQVTAVPEKLAAPPTPDEPSAEEEGPGLIDLLAQGEEAMPKLLEALEALTREVNQVGELMQEATRDLQAAESRNPSFATRLTHIRKFAQKLESPAQRIEDHGREYARALLDTDPAIHALLDSVEEEIDKPGDATPQGLENALEFLGNVKLMATSADEGMAGLRGFLAGLDEISGLSRDVRRPATQMEKGLQGMVDGHELTQAWAERARQLEAHLAEDRPAAPQDAEGPQSPETPAG
jgi:hypothetical protein